MELDKRITIISDIYSVNDGCHNWKFMNQKGYFANTITDFQDLSGKCVYGEYVDYREQDKCFSCKVDLLSRTSGAYVSDWFTYFIPEDDLKPEEPEKKYRPYTDKEFLTLFDLGKFHSIRVMDDPYTRVVITGTYSKNGILYISVSNNESGYGVSWLFKHCEYFNGEEWRPFGIEE